MNKRDYINWTEKLSVQVESIDQQHKILLQIANDLFEELLEPEFKENPMSAYRKLKVYVREHFQYEVKLFNKSEWPGRDDHINKHTKLIKQLEEVKKEINKSSEYDGAIKMLELFKNWFCDHILVEDKKYSGHLKSKGIK